MRCSGRPLNARVFLLARRWGVAELGVVRRLAGVYAKSDSLTLR